MPVLVVLAKVVATAPGWTVQAGMVDMDSASSPTGSPPTSPVGVDRSGHGSRGSAIPVPRLELRRLGDEVARALRAVTEARASTDAVQALSLVTIAVEQLTATQRELVDVLLDHGYTWGEVGEALASTARSAERRFPRRGRRIDPPAGQPQ